MLSVITCIVYDNEAVFSQERNKSIKVLIVPLLISIHEHEINRALIAGDAPEMLHGLLHWKARDLMEKGSRAWKSEESRALSLNLISLLQTSRRGGLDLSTSLERFALSI